MKHTQLIAQKKLDSLLSNLPCQDAVAFYLLHSRYKSRTNQLDIIKSGSQMSDIELDFEDLTEEYNNLYNSLTTIGGGKDRCEYLKWLYKIKVDN